MNGAATPERRDRLGLCAGHVIFVLDSSRHAVQKRSQPSAFDCLLPRKRCAQKKYTHNDLAEHAPQASVLPTNNKLTIRTKTWNTQIQTKKLPNIVVWVCHSDTWGTQKGVDGDVTLTIKKQYWIFVGDVNDARVRDFVCLAIDFGHRIDTADYSRLDPNFKTGFRLISDAFASTAMHQCISRSHVKQNRSGMIQDKLKCS